MKTLIIVALLALTGCAHMGDRLQNVGVALQARDVMVTAPQTTARQNLLTLRHEIWLGQQGY